MRNPLLRLAILPLVLLLSYSIHPQGLPKTIRGYKVHRPAISINADLVQHSTDATASGPSKDTTNNPPLVAIGSPTISDVSLTGVTIGLPMSLTSPDRGGSVDFLTFHDFRVNGIPVSIDEYRRPFELRKNHAVDLPEDVLIFVNSGRILQASWMELRDSRAEWLITGRAFIFGKFKRFGFQFKRAVPVDISIRTKNPFRK